MPCELCMQRSCRVTSLGSNMSEELRLVVIYTPCPIQTIMERIAMCQAQLELLIEEQCNGVVSCYSETDEEDFAGGEDEEEEPNICKTCPYKGTDICEECQDGEIDEA